MCGKDKMSNNRITFEILNVESSFEKEYKLLVKHQNLTELFMTSLDRIIFQMILRNREQTSFFEVDAPLVKMEFLDRNHQFSETHLMNELISCLKFVVCFACAVFCFMAQRNRDCRS